MGANQSSGKLQQQQYERAQQAAVASGLAPRDGDRGSSHKKDSFSRQQLNRLMGRRGSQTSASKSKQSEADCANAIDLRNDDEWRAIDNKSISERPAHSFVPHSNPSQYFVTQQQQPRESEPLESDFRALSLASGNINNNNNNNNNSNNSSPARPATLAEHNFVTAYQRQQQQQIVGDDKYIMTPSQHQRPATRQPLDSSAHHHFYNHQRQAQQATLIGSGGGGGGAKPTSCRPSNNALASLAPKPTTKQMPKVHKSQQQATQQALKSSCSPSSVSSSAASSATSPSSSCSLSNSSAASSSSDSFKLLQTLASGKQEQQRQQQSASTTGGNKKSNEASLAKLNITTGNNGNDYAIKSQQQQQTLVAMQQQPQQQQQQQQVRAQPLSWSKQQHHYQMMMLAGLSTGNQQQQAQLEQANAYQVFDQRQQQQQHPFAISAEGAQQYYGPADFHMLTNQQQQQQQPHEQLYPSFGYASAPLQRRHKWPAQAHQQQQQQYQYSTQQQQQPIYNQTNLDFQLAEQPSQYGEHVYLQRQHNLGPSASHLLLEQQQQHLNQLAQEEQLYSAQVGSLRQARSKSLSKSAVASNKHRSRNPLAAIFPFVASSSSPRSSASALQNHQQQQVTSTSKAHRKHQARFGSNTIHLSSAKSHQNLMLGSASKLKQQQQQAASQKLSSSSSLKRVKSGPLTAQQTSYEAMRTIDMYLIRQIARSCMDFEMEQKIDLEIRLRELAAQSMLEAQNEIDVLEVEKSLLASDQRMNYYAQQLEQQRKRLSSTPSLAGTNSDSGRGSKISGRANAASTGRPTAHPRSDVVGADPVTPTGGLPATSGSSGTSNANSPSNFSSLLSTKTSSQVSPVSGQSGNSAPSPCPGEDAPSPRSGADRRRRSNGSAAARARASGTDNNGGTLDRLANRRSQQSLAGAGKSHKQRQRERLGQAITAKSNINCHNAVLNAATLSLSELRVPLMWRDVDHFKGRGDYRRYAVFCLLKIGSQIYDTKLISDVDRQMTDLNFDDTIVFSRVEHDFELELEIYSCVYLEQFSLSSTPRKLKEKLSNSVSRAMGRRLASQTASVNYTKELEAYDKSYRFAMIASAKLSLADASSSANTYDLHLVSPEAHGRGHTALASVGGQRQSYTAGQYISSTATTPRHLSTSGQTAGLVTPGNQRDVHKNTLPLFGHFCCQLSVRPDVFDKCVKSGYLRVASIHLPETLEQDDKQQPQGDDRRHNNDLNSTSNHSTDSMLRSALAASSKLATISMTSSTVHWAMLRNFTLNLWQVDEQKLQLALRRGHAPQVDISRKQPIRVSIDKYSRLLRVSNSSLTIETDKGCFVLAIYNPATAINQAASDELGQWLRSIEQMIYDSHVWGAVLNHYPAQRS